jgi:hypothetical protein
LFSLFEESFPIRRRQTRETREENLRSVCGFKSGNSKALLSRAAREIKQGRPARLCAISDRPPLWLSMKPCSKKLEPAIGNIPETGIGLIPRFSRQTEKGFFYEGGALCHP